MGVSLPKMYVIRPSSSFRLFPFCAMPRFQRCNTKRNLPRCATKSIDITNFENSMEEFKSGVREEL